MKITIEKNNFVNDTNTFSYTRGKDVDGMVYSMKTVGFVFSENSVVEIDIASLSVETNKFGKTYTVKNNEKWDLISNNAVVEETKVVVKNRTLKSFKFPNLKNYSPEDGMNTAWGFWSDTDGGKYKGFVDPEKFQKNAVFSVEGYESNDKWGTQVDVKSIDIRAFDLNKPEFFLKNIGFGAVTIEWALENKIYDKITNLDYGIADIKAEIVEAKKSKALKGIGDITLNRIIAKSRLARKEIRAGDEGSIDTTTKFKNDLMEILVDFRIQGFWNKNKGERDRYLDKIHKGFVEILGENNPDEFKNKYGVSGISDIPNAIKKNPYILINLNNNGFKTVDIIARQMGVEVAGIDRQEACVNGILNGEIQGGFGGNGDIYLDREALFGELVENLEIKDDSIEDKFTKNDSDRLFRHIRLSESGDFYHWMDIDESGTITEKFTNKKNYTQEELVFKRVQQGIESSKRRYPIIPEAEVGAWIRAFESREGGEGSNYTLSDEQVKAVRLTCANDQSMFCMTGFAGTGKSTVSKAILEILELANRGREGIECLAVSGMASRRINEATGFNSTTITSYLFNPRRVKNTSVLFIDEASMVDSETMHFLLKAVDVEKTKIILVGDVGQLPPIGRGTPFKDILESGWVKSISLEKIFRQNEDAVLTTFAKSMRFENIDEHMYSGEYSDFGFIGVDDDQLYKVRHDIRILEDVENPEYDVKMKIRDKRIQLNKLLTLCNTNIRQEVGNLIYRYKDDFKKDYTSFQLMSPQKSTIVGTESINYMAQDILNDGNATFMDGDISINGKKQYKRFKIGDKVIHTKNENWFFNDNLGYFKNGKFMFEGSFTERFKNQYCHNIQGKHSIRILNGMVGIIDSFNTNTKEITVKFAYEDIHIGVIYKIKDLGSLHLGYCLTIHKLQGSEAKTVGLIVSPSHVMMINNNLLYTGITRGKSKGFILGSKRAFKQGLKKHGTIRQTLLPLLFNGLLWDLNDRARKKILFDSDSWGHDIKETDKELKICSADKNVGI